MRISKDFEINISDLIKRGAYIYKCVFEGCVCTSSSIGENGMYYAVELEGENEDVVAFAKHEIIIGENKFRCNEYEDASQEWFFNDEEIEPISNSTIKEIINKVKSIITPFNFEQYAIDSFCGDVIAESIPYGDPYCLVIDNSVFMIEEDDDLYDSMYDEQKIRNFLAGYNWSDKRINKALSSGYEIVSDVYNVVCNLPITYNKR